MRVSSVSLMPTGLLDALKEELTHEHDFICDS